MAVFAFAAADDGGEDHDAFAVLESERLLEE